MIEIYTDGACIKNPGGPGGWGFVMIKDNLVYEKGGYSPETTNNKMELTAAIEALKAVDQLKQKAAVYTDSQYVKNGITVWIKSWKANGWERKGDRGGKEVKNLELWKELDELNNRNIVEWRWVKGHADNPHNCRADEIATGFARQKDITLAEGLLDDKAAPPNPPKPERKTTKQTLPEQLSCIKLLFSQSFIAALPELLVKIYGFSKLPQQEESISAFRNPYMEISWDKTGIADVKPIITSKTVEIVENLRKEEAHLLDENLKRKPIEFPTDFSRWNNIHFQQFLRPILKGMSQKWKMEKIENRVILTLVENPEETGEIECGREYVWKVIPGETHRKLIIQASENAVIFPDRVIASVKNSKDKTELLSFYLCSNSWNIISCYNTGYLKEHWDEISSDEKQRVLGLIWKRLDRANRINMAVPKPFASVDSKLSERLVFQSLFLLHTDAAEIIKRQKAGDKKFKLDVIMEEPDENEWGADTLVACLPDWQLFKKPSNSIEKKAVELAEFLISVKEK